MTVAGPHPQSPVRMSWVGVLLACALLGAACGGAGTTEGTAETDATPAEVVAPSAQPTNNDPGEASEDLPFVSALLELQGDTEVRMTPGEIITMEYALHNATDRAQRFTLFATSSGDIERPALERETVRLDPRAVTSFTAELVVPESAEVGDRFSVDVLAALSGADRSVVTTDVVVVDAQGSRPVAAPDSAVAPNSQQTSGFVIVNDTDPDGDIDFSTARLVSPGFRSAEAAITNMGSFTYLPFNNVSGQDLVIYEVCDKEGRCDTAIVSITIQE